MNVSMDKDELANLTGKEEARERSNSNALRCDTESVVSTTTTLDFESSEPARRENGASKHLTADESFRGGLSQAEVATSTRMSYNSSDNTSDVSSDGDAASIVSRLSQIVVEEECKLNSSLRLLDGEKPSETKRQEAAGAEWRRENLPVNFNFHKGVRRNVASSDSLAAARRDWSRRKSIAGDIVPKINIHLMDDEVHFADNFNRRRANAQFEDLHLTRPTNNRMMTHLSESTSKPEEMRRNQSFGFLPERGDLRRLESYRKQENFRKRSNTGTNLDRQNILLDNNNSDLVLNIKRSAWRLSDFDNTFEANQAERCNSCGPEVAAEGTEGPAKEANQAAENILKRSSSNLRLFSSSRRKSLSSRLGSSCQEAEARGMNRMNSESNLKELGQSQRAGEQSTKPNKSDPRRLSSSHSISSVATSAESLYAGFGNNIYKSALMRSRRAGGPKQREEPSAGQNCCSSCFRLETFSQYLPVLEWLSKYKAGYFLNDLTGGCVVAIMNISTCISAAVVAETDLSVAFRASIINTFIYSILCSSRHSSFGSWSIISQMLLVSVEKALNDEYVLDQLNLGTSSLSKEDYDRWHYEVIVMYTFSIGLIQLVCGLLNLGSILSSFIPEALCSSLIAGTAVTMAFNQLANMLGTSNKLLAAADRNTTELLFNNPKRQQTDIADLFAGLFVWLNQMVLLAKHYHLINPACLLISLLALLLLFLNQYFIQRRLEALLAKKILVPFEVILVVLAIPVTCYFELADNYKVPTCGPIEASFVMPNIPDVRLIRELWDQSLATALISYTITYVMAKSYGNKLNYEVDFNQELIACGAGNLVGGLFDALPATASFIRTAGNVEAGGRTQMSGIINCLLLIGAMQLFGGYARYLPVCLMSTCLFFGFVRLMSRLTDSLKYWRICKVDFAIWLFSFLAILALDIVNGFLYGFIFTIFTMLYRAQNRRCYMLGAIDNSEVFVPLIKYKLAKEIQGIKIFQFCGPIHFVCADLFEHLLRQKTKVNVRQVLKEMNKNKEHLQHKPAPINHHQLNLPTHIILDFSMISFIDSAGIHIIKKIIQDYQEIQVTILIASLASHVAAVVKCDSGLWDTYKDRFYVGLADAVHFAISERRQERLLAPALTGTMQPPAMIRIMEAKSL